MIGRTRREWLAELNALASEYDSLTDADAEGEIKALILESLGTSDFLLQLELVRNRRIRLAERNSRRPVLRGVQIDISDLLPDPEPHTPRRQGETRPVLGRHLQKSLVAKKHGGK